MVEHSLCEKNRDQHPGSPIKLRRVFSFFKRCFTSNFSLKMHYQIVDNADELTKAMKISDIYSHFCKSFPGTSLKAFGMCIRNSLPGINKKNSNSCAFYTNIKRKVISMSSSLKYIYNIFT